MDIALKRSMPGGAGNWLGAFHLQHQVRAMLAIQEIFPSKTDQLCIVSISLKRCPMPHVDVQDSST